MRIKLNGEYREVVEEITLGELIRLLAFPSNRIAIELNGTVVRQIDWSTIRLKANDRVEVVHFVGGGVENFELLCC